MQKGSRAGGDAHDAAAAAAPALHEALQRADDRNGGNDTGGSAGGGSSPLPLPLPRHTHRAAQSTSRPRSASQGAVPCLGAKGIVRGRCVAARSWVNRRAPQPRDPGLPHDRGLSDDLAPIRRPPSWQASPPPMPAGPSLFRACARSYPPPLLRAHGRPRTPSSARRRRARTPPGHLDGAAVGCDASSQLVPSQASSVGNK